MDDQDLMTVVREGFATVNMTTPAATVVARGKQLRRRRSLPLAAAIVFVAGAAVAGMAAVGASGGHMRTAHGPMPSGAAAPTISAKLAAWTVTPQADGTVKVTVKQMRDVSGLQAKLRADGVPVVVSASLGWPAACTEWRGGQYRMGSSVLRTANPTGLPSANGTELIISPRSIPHGALLWLGLSQTGKPNGIAGPPGAIGSGYLTSTTACRSTQP